MKWKSLFVFFTLQKHKSLLFRKNICTFHAPFLVHEEGWAYHACKSMFFAILTIHVVCFNSVIVVEIFISFSLNYFSLDFEQVVKNINCVELRLLSLYYWNQDFLKQDVLVKHLAPKHNRDQLEQCTVYYLIEQLGLL